MINPFKPNSPTRPGMFVGRLSEINKIDAALSQTKADRTQSFLLLGERGIGKTSLLNLVKIVAEGDIQIDKSKEKHNFLVIEIDISKDTTQLALIKKIQIALKRKLAQSELTKKVFGDIWNFISKLEVAGVKINNDKDIDHEILFEEFAYSLADTLNRITKKDSKNPLDSFYDGIVIIIDETDNATPTLDLGSFVKLITRKTSKRRNRKTMFGVSGLPKTKEILIASHPSSIRIFEELNLDRLSNDEIKRVIERVLEDSLEINKTVTVITPEAEELLVGFAEGFPHFIHQYGYCAFEVSNGKIIKKEDVETGAYQKNGALECIGKKYYHDDYYNKIKADNYRQVLIIMSAHLDGWVTRKQIKSKFKGTDQVLANALSALQTRNIIIAKDGARGTYKLQDKGFAWWIAMNQKREAIG